MTREGLERLALDVLAQLAERYLAAGQYADAGAVARRRWKSTPGAKPPSGS